MTEYQVIWRGIVHDSTGYARAGRQYVLELDRLGVDVKLEAIAYAGGVSDGLPASSESRLSALATKPLAEHKPRILVIHLQPGIFDPAAERRRYDRVIGCAAWETTRVPDWWVQGANQLDALVGFSTQSLQAFRDSGITAPLYHVPHGASAGPVGAGPSRTPVPPFEGHFKFLSVLRWDHRKAPEVLLRAFWQEFSVDDRALLILKTYPGDPCNLRSRLALRDQLVTIKRSLGFDATRAPVLANVDSLTDAQMARLYRAADVFVLPTRGEAAGLPFLEAMASGLPVIATGWGGQTDFLNEENSWLVDYDLESTTSRRSSGVAWFFDNLFNDRMMWAEPRIPHLRAVMRRALGSPGDVASKGRCAQRDASALTWASCAARFAAALDAVTRAPARA